jgi:hypothetical protein
MTLVYCAFLLFRYFIYQSVSEYACTFYTFELMQLLSVCVCVEKVDGRSRSAQLMAMLFRRP